MKEILGKIEDHIAQRWDSTCPQPGEGEHFSNPHRYVTSATEGHLKHLFYWDAYFSAIGLLHHGRVGLAKSTLEALVHLFHLKGFVPNVDVEQGANRSQLPFLSHFTRLIYENTGDKTFLAQMVSVLKDEYLFWMTDRAGAVPGLNRFSHSATNDYLTDFYMGTLCPRLGFDPNASEEEKFCVASHYLAEAESTADFTSRFLGRAGDFLAIDLNANLYGYETNFAWFAQELASAEAAPFWLARAERRKRLMAETFWNEERGWFFDYDAVNGAHSPVWTPMAFTALWNGLATPAQAARMVANLAVLETPFGLAATDTHLLDTHLLDMPLQWDHPFGWPPHQYLAVHGLLRYGFEDDARRIAAKFLDLIVRVYEETGELWEKYDLQTGGLRSSEYAVQTQIGWTAAVFLDFSKLLNPDSAQAQSPGES